MKNKKQKGYVLAIVLILVLLMTIIIASAFTILMRYMLSAQDNLNSLADLFIFT